MLNDLQRIAHEKIVLLWNAIVNVGIHPGMPFMEVRRTKMLNLLALPCIPCMFFFCLLNLYQGRYLLSSLNLCTTLGALGVLYLHYNNKYLSARLSLIVTSAIVYTFTGFYFHNGSEYFLINIVIVIVLVYDSWWIIGVASFFLITVFLGIVYFPQHMDGVIPVPKERVWLNATISLAFPVIGLTFFKSIHSDYQKEIENSRANLVNMNTDKEKLFSIIAHDVRSPLATLEVLLDMFLKGEYPEKDMLEAAQVLHEKVAQLGGSLDNILRWSSRSMKGIHANPTLFPLLPLVTDVLYFFRLQLMQKNIAIRMKVEENVVLYADRDHVSVILRNFISNALKFSYAGGDVGIEARLASDRVAISITDDGKGMSPKQVGELFSYSNHPEYGTNGERGTGLGLVLCREFAIQNGGSINVESMTGKGTSFTILLPAIAPADDEDDCFN
ncbi:sensor histidine kinase KdpD [Chitinophaga sp. sic0106]|uniref:sensor histidine kinase n=1 Tax=Chitinophaga sp. sic0106 TaxID=2854785 RepID=UPI001C4762C3|nr:HAMP domain-containing sensor histidine kinase [Chitinophaga sp. sic0106]MBV7530321.1 HAMP domain-containing histidine kinase [Chitinophaga sp. sic0106]